MYDIIRNMYESVVPKNVKVDVHSSNTKQVIMLKVADKRTDG